MFRNHLCEGEMEAASRRMLVKAYSLSSHKNQDVFMAKKNKTVRTINGKRLVVWHVLSRCTLKLDGSKISNLSIDRVHPMHVHDEKFKGKPTYPDAISLCLMITYLSVKVLQKIAILHSCGGLLGSYYMNEVWMEKWRRRRHQFRRSTPKLESSLILPHWWENETLEYL